MICDLGWRKWARKSAGKDIRISDLQGVVQCDYCDYARSILNNRSRLKSELVHVE